MRITGRILKKRQIIDYILISTILLVGIFILYGKGILGGEVIVPGDIPYNTPVWQGTAPKIEYYSAQNYLLSDQVCMFYAWHYMAFESIKKSGSIPYWNPYEFTGQPLIANAQSSLFYPPNLLLHFFKPGTVATFRAIFNMLIAGIFTFLFCRIIGISRYGSILASIAFTFSGPLTVWLGYPLINVFVWIPFMLWAAENLILSINKTLWAFITGIGIGASILGGHPETTFHVLGTYLLYLILRVYFKNKNAINRKRILSGFLLAVIIGGLLGSIQLLPFTDFLLDSATLSSGGRSNIDQNILYGKNWYKEVLSAVTLLYPNFFGNPSDRNYFTPLGNGNYNENAMYFGLIPLMFAFGSLFILNKPGKMKIIIFFALISAAVAWRLPGFDIINHLPFFSLVHNGRMRIVFTFFSIILAGFGFDYFKRYLSEKKKYQKMFLAMISVPIMSVIILLVISVLKSFAITNEMLNPVSEKYVFNYKDHLLFNIFSFEWIKTIVPTAVVIMVLITLLLYVKKRINFHVLQYLLIFTLFIELLVFAWGFNPTIKEGDILPENAVIKYLKADNEPNRIITLGNIYFPNYNVKHNIFHLGGYDMPVFQTYSDIFRKSGGKNIHSHSWSVNSELINFLNVKYIIASKKSRVPEKFVLKKRFYAVDIYENPNVFPRAFMVYDFEQREDRNAILNDMLKEDFNFKNKVLLENGLYKEEKQELDRDRTVAADYKIDFKEYNSDSIVIDIETSRAGIFVSSEINSSGWKAELDGKPISVLSANYGFRSVYIQKGKHKLKFFYDPISIKIGKILSISGVLILIFYFIYFIYKKRETFRI